MFTEGEKGRTNPGRHGALPDTSERHLLLLLISNSPPPAFEVGKPACIICRRQTLFCEEGRGLPGGHPNTQSKCPFPVFHLG